MHRLIGLLHSGYRSLEKPSGCPDHSEGHHQKFHHHWQPLHLLAACVGGFCVSCKDTQPLCASHQGHSGVNMTECFNMDGEVVLVTGGAGFLGQHVIRMLQLRVTGLKEIRVFDIKPYENRLGHREIIPVRNVVGDLRNMEDISKALDGVDSVIHTAGVVSFGTFPDHKAMEEVNVKGTSNLISGSLDRGVKRFVHTSTVDVVIGYQPIRDGDESFPVPDRFLFSGYPDTKYRAEQLVLGADKTPILGREDQFLRTVSLRPNVMYGELDPYYIVSGLRSAAQNKGVLPRVGGGQALFQQAYAGNVAWAHVCALQALRQPATECAAAGRAYFITDDTPIMNSFTFMEPFLQGRGYSLSSYSLPYSLVYCVMHVMESVLRLVAPLHKVNMATSLASLIYINMDVYFRRDRAEKLLGYTPVYSYAEAIAKSLSYYNKLNLY